ncbi:MAG: hypothetical protein V3U91_00780 [Candidatus Aminicenantaceae bacterium]
MRFASLFVRLVREQTIHRSRLYSILPLKEARILRTMEVTIKDADLSFFILERGLDII